MGGYGMRFSVRLGLTRSSTRGRGAARARTVMAAVGAAVVLAAGVLAAAAPAGAAGSRWHIQHTPGLPPWQGALAADSCASATACLAVGSYNDGFYQPLAERWNGTSWSLLKPRIPKGAVNTNLLGVSCASASDCIAVGTYDNANVTYRTLAEVWHGGSWSIQRTPNPAHSTSTSLASVSCTSARSCTAVGYSGGFRRSQTLAEAWNGTSWSIRPTPDPAASRHASLTSVSCTSSSACVAVGTAERSKPLAERWNGAAWSLRQVPAPAGATQSNLRGVSCAPAGTCVAVGNYRTGSGRHLALADTWHGATWAIAQAAIPAGAVNSYLNAVSCLSASACTAVGIYQPGTGAHITLAEAWDGTSWSIQATPNPAAARAGLSAVSCQSAAFCAAVGSQLSHWQVTATVAEAWDGASWSLQRAPGPAVATQSDLSAVACPATADCFGVGQAGTDSGTGTLTQHWDGTAWATQRTPANPGFSDALDGITCTSATACTAVGGTFAAPRTARTLAERWNGTSWSVQPTPSEPTPQINLLTAVSCVTASSCVAVGLTGPNPYVPLAEVWNGTSWSIHNPAAGGPGDKGLYGVSCVSASDCIAVGFTGNNSSGDAPAADRWDGTAWSAQPVPVPAGTRNSLLDGLSCVSANACTAVGYWQNSSGNQSVLVERWNGTAWSVQPAPDPSTNGASLSAVSCVSASACTTVGFYDTNSGDQRTLAEVWDGTAWSVQPTASPANAASQLNGLACRAPRTCTAVGVSAGAPGSHGGSATLAEAEP